MTTDARLQRTGSAGAAQMEQNMKKNTKRSVLAGIAVLAAGASIAGGASVTAAAIDTAEPVPSDATIVVQQVAQDADGGWYSCEMSLDDTSVDVSPVPAGVIESGTAAVGSFTPVGEGIEISAVAPGDGSSDVPTMVSDTSGGVTGVAVAVAGDGTVSAGGDIGTAIELPGPDDIREGTAEECAALQG